ncbi:MAG: Glu-tRNA(Gln) amidotransferase subunit GatE [Desulfurococcaceae archaeon]|uniref:Glutamyl-tRNA(Gln) amidotransferase subunit E n=1 Tax=Staphylothermus marinus TaxID=2280 RepID=A0A7C4NPQ3_STAMA
MSSDIYAKHGLRIGLEIHVQLDTKHKLFCNCPTMLSEDNEDVFERELRPARSELKEVDVAAMFEWKRGRRFEYYASRDYSCLVEADEEPPHEVNREALVTALAVARALNMYVPDRIYVMRKIVLDGSNTSGFQRTMLVALNGYIDDEEGRVGIQTLCLEEDAARKVVEDVNKVTYRLDRLGIPLIEIATAPDIKNPKQAWRVAYKLGQLVRLTGKAKRGLGTIRQDLNVSIRGGGKVEIKGVQHISLIPIVIENEFMRQIKLLEIRDELAKRGVSLDKFEVANVTDIFKNTKCKVIARIMGKQGYGVFAINLKGFKGILGIEVQPGRRFGTELSDYAKAWGGVGGIFHTDELPGYGISDEEVKELYIKMNADPSRDCIVIVADEEERAVKALEAVFERARSAIYGVPEETRVANEDGTTRYARPRPGQARMYPETDIPPIYITKEIIEEADRIKPESYDAKLKKFIETYGLSRSLAEQVLNDLRLDLFEKIVDKYRDKISPSVIASTIVLASSLDPHEKIADNVIEEIINYVAQGRVAKEAIPNILETLVKKPDAQLSRVIDELGLTTISIDELESIIDEIIQINIDSIKAKPSKAFNIVMGEVMKKVRGRIDGTVVAEHVKRKLNTIIKS